MFRKTGRSILHHIKFTSEHPRSLVQPRSIVPVRQDAQSFIILNLHQNIRVPLYNSFHRTRKTGRSVLHHIKFTSEHPRSLIQPRSIVPVRQDAQSFNTTHLHQNCVNVSVRQAAQFIATLSFHKKNHARMCFVIKA